MVDLSVAIGEVTLANPIMPGSGTFADGMDRVIDLDRLGALVSKTITPDVREGNPQPRVTEYRDAMLCSIGIPSKGPEHYVDEVVPFYRNFRPPLVCSISASTAAAFGELAARVSVDGVAVIEANISCPNLEQDGRAFAMEEAATRSAIAAIKAASDRPIWAKLTPNVGDITLIARAAATGGADALVVANALLGMAIDTESFRPKLGNLMGGLTGPAVKPVILRMVYQCAQAVDLPIIGCGGIATCEDVVEYLLAGASAVQVGTASFRHPSTMTRLLDELPAWCERKGIARVADLTGAMIADVAEPEREAAV
ncbi:MAG: dihydroorotate dehydrogenase [Alphaproteobacteria bacterium]|jgi:dihydroorotate dehydrogenase (NAD+) catalytic subunit|nr:dihydroorotate dehydrogenase B catalytic subunit [Rhodospirillaceae bacterium]MDP6405694.1 dihydroorotate dehydrogenase [Alphaproteobacteria bacterium]MDP6624252.1 dihydroorotate dehydrogenase [Alphaproteobacteria bacterium]|tara:strand:+ start:458 stop:1393 length:936 start_codon:yes stop_codon:yes gene_type:complete